MTKKTNRATRVVSEQILFVGKHMLLVEGLDIGLSTLHHCKRNSQLPSELAASFRFHAHAPQSLELFSEFLKMLS